MPFQVSVFAENKAGKIEKVTSILKENNINIRAITISDSGDYGIIKLLLDNPFTGCEKLEEAGVTAALKEVIAVKMDDTPGGLNRVASIMNANEVNVQDAYGFILESGGSAVFVFQVENSKKVEKILKDEGISVLADNELYLL